MYYWAYYAPFLIGGGIKQCFCLTSLCLSVAYIGPKSRTERPRNTKISTEVDHVTRDSDTTFKVKGQGHRVALLTAVLAHQAAAAVGVGTCWPWETAATSPSARRRKAIRRPRGGGARAYRGGRPPTACLLGGSAAALNSRIVVARSNSAVCYCYK